MFILFLFSPNPIISYHIISYHCRDKHCYLRFDLHIPLIASKKPSLAPLSLLSVERGTGREVEIGIEVEIGREVEIGIEVVVIEGCAPTSSDKLLIIPPDLLAFFDISGREIVEIRAGPRSGPRTESGI